MELEQSETNTENVAPSNHTPHNKTKMTLKPAAHSLFMTPGKKTVLPNKAQTAIKSKFQTPKTNSGTDSLSSTLTSQFSSTSSACSTAATSVTRPKTCSKIPNKGTTGTIATTTPSTVKSDHFKNSILNTDVSVISSSTLDNPSPVDAREAAKIAKLQNTQQRIFKVNLLKEKWAKEKQTKLALYQAKKQLEMKQLQEENSYQAEIRRKQIEKQRELDELKKENEKKDLLIRHEANILMKKDIEKEKQARRRISIFINQSIRKKQVQAEKELEEKKKQQEVEDLTLKRIDALTIREQKTIEEMKRRESLHNRLEAGKIAKEKEKEVMNSLYYQRDQDLLDIRYANWQDEKIAQQLQQLEEKEHLQKQEEIFKQQKQIENQLRTMKELETINLLKSRELNWKDEQFYKQTLQEQEKNEMIWKLNHWKLNKQQQEEITRQEAIQKQISKELEYQAYQDMKDYEQSLKEQRRQSLSYRLQKAKKDHDYEIGLKANEQLVAEKEKQLRDGDYQDMKNYKQHLQNLRRQSLEYRSQLYYQERMRQQGEEQTMKQQEQDDYELRRQAWKDVQEYQSLERQKQRESIAWRIADAHRQHEIELVKHQEQLQAMHLDLQCRHEDWKSLQSYKQEEKEKRRKSIQMRLASWKQQKIAEENEKLKQLMMDDENAILKEMDREELLAAKLTKEMMEKRNMLSASEMQF